MKKLLLMFAVLVLSTGTFAQTRLAIEGGLDLAYVTGMKKYFSGSAPFAGGFLGMQAKFQFNDLLGIRTGVGYAQQGLNTSYSGSKDIERTIGNYFNIPLMLSFSFLDDNLQVAFGPQLGIAASIKDYSVVYIDNVPVKNNFRWEPGSDYNVCDLAMDVCVQYLFNGNIGIKLQYNFGLTDVFKGFKYKERVFDSANSNMVGQIGLVYMFDEL